MNDQQAHVRAFFGPRAAGWDTRFGDDGPAYAAAATALGLRSGDTVLDAGCGTGRALEPLRAAIGPTGRILGLDLTPEMLAAAVDAGRDAVAWLAIADVARLPLQAGVVDAVFAAGLVGHLPDPAAGLRELARVVRPGGTLALFHPLGRAALAAYQRREPSPDDLRAEHRLRPLLTDAGWRLRSYTDEDARFLALARRDV